MNCGSQIHQTSGSLERRNVFNNIYIIFHPKGIQRVINIGLAQRFLEGKAFDDNQALRVGIF